MWKKVLRTEVRGAIRELDFGRGWNQLKGAKVKTQKESSGSRGEGGMRYQ